MSPPSPSHVSGKVCFSAEQPSCAHVLNGCVSLLLVGMYINLIKELHLPIDQTSEDGWLGDAAAGGAAQPGLGGDVLVPNCGAQLQQHAVLLCAVIATSAQLCCLNCLSFARGLILLYFVKY